MLKEKWNIKYVKNKHIDMVKYDNCIENAFNTRIYAFSWYLNCVTDTWDILVLNDYEAVMPLPKRKKYGIRYVYQVPWIQQLGVFSSVKIDKSLLKKFISKIPRKFILVDYYFNSENKLSNKNIQKRTNYILSLQDDFNAIKSSFNKNRKRITNKDFEKFYLERELEVNTFLNFYKSQKLKFKTHQDVIAKLEKLLNSKNSAINLWGVFCDGNLISALVWLKDEHRITYLLPVANKEAKNNNIPTFLVNTLIKTYQKTNYTLDFEGSTVDGVARFYKSFGAIKETYYWYYKGLV